MAYALISRAAPGSGVRRHGSPQGDGLSLIAQLCPCSALGHQRFQDYDSNESTLQRKSGVIAGCSRAGGRDVSDHDGDGGAAHGFPKDSGTCAVLSSLRIWKSGPCRVTLYDRNLIERPSRKPGAFFLVRVVGIEPTLCHQNWILSPARLPVPPHPPVSSSLHEGPAL